MRNSDLGKTARAPLRRHGRRHRRCGGLCADLAENPVTKGAMSSERAMRGFKAAMDAALGRGSQALTEWIEDLR